jgi:tripartite-type tricarboxylate transporter receptor subunit TctC
MNESKRRFALRAATGAALLATALITSAQTADAGYPSRPVTIVVPHAPGGPVDRVARMFAEHLKDDLRQSVVVENRAGASSMIGAASVARSAPDGYTLYINASIHSINPLLHRKSIQFDAVKDFTAISLLAQGPLVFVVHPGVPGDSARAFADTLKSDPSRFSFATGGFGAADHLASAYFLHEIGMGKVPIVLYKGGAPALQDLVGGQVSAKMDAIITALPLVKAGKLRALAVTGATRSPLLPDVPTMQESGFRDFEFTTWYGLWAPARLPQAIVDRLDAAARRIMALPTVQQSLSSQGFIVNYRPPAGFSAFVDSEMTRYQKIITAADIKIE